MELTYCYEWNQVLSEPIRPFGEVEARRRHDAGELYTAISWVDGRPDAYVEVRFETAYVGCTFFDEQLRFVLMYSFDRISVDRMFLVEARDLNPDDHSKHVITEFEVDGTMTRKLASNDFVEVADTPLDGEELEALYEPVPHFGQYESLLRRERDLSVADQPA